MKILLHACCAPCALSCLESPRRDGFEDVTLFFYNPNIHPSAEFHRRLSETKKVTDKIVRVDYDPSEYFNAITDFENRENRCRICWELRIRKAASFAKDNRFDAFTTTLLSSPYQDHDVLMEIGRRLEKETGVRFYYADFRKDFRKAHDQARAKGIYCQNYCGCVFSMVEKWVKSEIRNPKYETNHKNQCSKQECL